MKILVTGATGFVGSHLVKELLARGHSVRILRRTTSPLRMIEGLPVETIIGDVTERDSVQQAVKGCQVVFHVAGHISFWSGNNALQTKINVQGTRHVVEAALAAGTVERLIHTSSIAAIGIPDGIGDETLAYNWWPHHINYCNSKYLAEQEVQRGVKLGLNAVIVNPATIFGPGDLNLNAGAIVLQMKKGRIPFFIPGGCCTCDVADVVAGHIGAWEKGRTGERYILGGENLTWKEIMLQVAEVIGVKPPQRKIPTRLFSLMGHGSDIISHFTKKEPTLSRESTLMAQFLYYFSSEKAKRELGYRFIPFRESAKRTHDWYFPKQS